MRDGLTAALAGVLAEAADRPPRDPPAHLAAGLIVTAWSVAFSEAQHVFAGDGGIRAARRVFLALIDQGFVGVTAAMAGTAYV